MKMNNQFDYFLLNKPYGVLSQFTPEAGHRSLKDYGPFPKAVYPVGRLDADSEGLLLLTNDNRLKHRLTTPTFRHERTYLVQVEGIPTESSLQKLREGLLINDFVTLPAKVRVLHQEPPLPPRPVAIRFRKNIPTSWIEMMLLEGRNRQIRRMTATVGYPTLRLVRTHISFLTIDGLLAGQSRSLTEREISRLVELTRGGEEQ